MESYVWVRPTAIDTAMSGSIRALTALAESIPVVDNISRQLQPSVRCSLVLVSELQLSLSAYKTDLYNISKIRSFVYTSLQTLAIHNVDIITRPRYFSMRTHDSRLNVTEMKDSVEKSLALCVDHTDAGKPLQFTVRRFIQHRTLHSATAVVTEIEVQSAFCPSASELECISQQIGALVISPTSRCVADIDILFTSFNPGMTLVQFEQYILQVQGYDPDMHLSHPFVCSDVLFIHHKAASDNYADTVNQQQELSALHSAYHVRFGNAIIFNSGVHLLAVYNVTMRIAPPIVPDTVLGAITNKGNTERADRDKTQIVRTLNLLGINITAGSVRTPATMNMRETANDAHSVTFSLSGAVLPAADIITAVNATVWLSTSRYAPDTSLEIKNFSSSISGSLLFDGLSLSEAQELCVHVNAHRPYYSPATAPLFSATITQTFVVPSALTAAGVEAQNGGLQQWVHTSSFVFRVSVRIPIEVSRLNALLVEVLKTVIFQREKSNFVQIASISGQIMPTAAGWNTTSTEYAFIVYELAVPTIQQCDLHSNINTDDYFLEIGNIVSTLFGLNIGFELHSACLVTNILHATLRPPPNSGCGGFECNDGIVAQYAATHAFLSESTVGYSERCVLNTHLLVDVRFDHLQSDAVSANDVMRLANELTYGQARGSLNIAMHAAIRLHDDTVVAEGLVQFFAAVNARGSIDATALGGSNGTAGFFALYNDGLSALEKPDCISARYRQSTASSLACRQNVSLSQEYNDVGNSCLRFTTMNSRIDITSLKRFVFSKTTAQMVRPNAISIANTLTAHIGRMACEGGVHNLLHVLLQSQVVQNTRLIIQRKHVTRNVFVIQHTTPFVHIADYRSNVLRILKSDDIEPRQWQQRTSTVLHLYTKGVTHETAQMFFAPLLLEYIRSQLEGPTQISVHVLNIHPLQHYRSVFPDSLFEQHENRVQLYIQVRILNMVECAEIQRFLIQRIVQQQISGVNMQVEIIDTVDVRTICSNTISFEYSSRECRDASTVPVYDTGVSGGWIISSNSSCISGSDSDCSALLTSSDVGLFFDSLRIITAHSAGLGFYFEHSADFCGLDAQLLGMLISKEYVDFFGTCLYQCFWVCAGCSPKGGCEMLVWV